MSKSKFVVTILTAFAISACGDSAEVAKKEAREQVRANRAKCEKASELLANVYKVKGADQLLMIGGKYCDDARIFNKQEDKLLCITSSQMLGNGDKKRGFDACMEFQ